MEDFNTKRKKLFLAYLEEKCHIHPTSEVIFEQDKDMEYNNVTIYPRIGGFDCGIRFTEGNILTWLIENDIKPSEVFDYSGNTCIDNPIDAPYCDAPVSWTQYFDLLSTYARQMEREYIQKMRNNEPITWDDVSEMYKDLTKKLQIIYPMKDEEHPVQTKTDIATVQDITDCIKEKMESNVASCYGNTEIELLIEENRRNGGGSFEYDDTLYIIDKDGSVTTKNMEHPKYDTASDDWFDVVKKGNPQRFG